MPDDLRDGADVIIIEIKRTVNAMHWNHPETTPFPPLHPPAHGEILSSMKLVPVPKGLGTTALKPGDSVLLTAFSPMVKAGFADHTDLSFDPM